MTDEEKKDLLGHINMQPINDEKDQIVVEVESDTANALREILKEFKHPIGSKVWWVGMELEKEGFKWYIVEREVKSVRVYVDKDGISKKIFLTGLTSYEGENWYNDEFEKLNIAEGLELYGAVGEDYIFDTENDAKKCYEIMKDKV